MIFSTVLRKEILKNAHRIAAYTAFITSVSLNFSYVLKKVLTKLLLNLKT